MQILYFATIRNRDLPLGHAVSDRQPGRYYALDGGICELLRVPMYHHLAPIVYWYRRIP